MSAAASPPTSDAGDALHRSPYDGLTPFSTALMGLRIEPIPARVNLLLPEVDPGGIFAGVRTAVEIGRLAAAATGTRLRLLLLKPVSGDPALRAQHCAAIQARLVDLGVEADVVAPEDLAGTAFGTADRWIATHWWTAHAIDVLAREGGIDASRVLYLVQDYEPGFVGWSTDSAVAASTYHAGFTMLVNSTPVAAHLEREGHPAPAAVFAPNLDLAELRIAAERRSGADRVRVFFYARPSKPRNLFGLGATALRLMAARCEAEGIPVEIVTAGEPIAADAIPGIAHRDLGTLPREAYFELLAGIDVGLSLQGSPHPSHPPLDLAISGARAITNELDRARGRLHPMLAAVEPRPEVLAEALFEAAKATLAEGLRGFEAPPDAVLGGDMAEAFAAAWARLR